MNRLEKINRLLTELKEEKYVKIVEGKKDRETLKMFGITNIKTIKKPLTEVVEEVKGKKAIILTDYDRTGIKLEKRIKELLENKGVTPDMKYKKELQTLTGIKKIEELSKRYEKIKEEVLTNGKNLH